jgi:hypothetical protein
MTTRSVFGLAILAGGLLLLSAAPALAQRSSCVDCHYADPSAPRGDHLADWERSAHGRAAVGCEKCHDGNASTYEAFLAHRGVRNSRDSDSPVHRRNLPATCGRCHTGPFVAFQKSHHFEMLQQGDNRVPTCVTCHEAVGLQLPSGKILEAECQRCHGPKGTAPRPERAAAARTLVESVAESRQLLKSVRPLIDRIKDPARKTALNHAYEQAEVPLIEAGRSVHEFVFDTLKERLARARQRIDALLSDLANPVDGGP